MSHVTTIKTALTGQQAMTYALERLHTLPGCPKTTVRMAGDAPVSIRWEGRTSKVNFAAVSFEGLDYDLGINLEKDKTFSVHFAQTGTAGREIARIIGQTYADGKSSCRALEVLCAEGKFVEQARKSKAKKVTFKTIGQKRVMVATL